jgi:hypothetical protein
MQNTPEGFFLIKNIGFVPRSLNLISLKVEWASRRKKIFTLGPFG